MSAVKLGGLMVWDETLVLLSVLIGIILSALAMAYLSRPNPIGHFEGIVLARDGGNVAQLKAEKRRRRA